jgi:hypothetical protein
MLHKYEPERESCPVLSESRKTQKTAWNFLILIPYPPSIRFLAKRSFRSALNYSIKKANNTSWKIC